MNLLIVDNQPRVLGVFCSLVAGEIFLQLCYKRLDVVEFQLPAELLDFIFFDVSVQNMLQFVATLRADGPIVGNRVVIVHH